LYQFELKAPKIPFISCLSGEMITTEDAISGDYWAKQLRNTVKFSKGISQLAENQNVMFIETGPNTHLSSFVRQNPSIQKKQAILASLGKPSKLREDEKLYTTIGGLWANGYELDFSLFRNSGKPNKLSLPTYPFERKRHWIDYIPDKMAGIQVSNTQTEKDDTASSFSSTVQDSSPVRLQEEIKLILSELSGFKTEDLKEDVVFDSMGFDSLFLTQFAVRLEKRYTIRVEFRKLALEYPTIQKLAEFLLSNSPVLAERKIQQEPVPKVHTGVLNNFAVFQDNGNKAPVVMVHGDEANIFLPKTLGSDQPFYGYFHIAADGDRIPFSDTVAMANHYVNQLLAHNAKGPFLLGGFSFGGILAFEMALQLQKMGYEIPMLVLIDSKSPYISRKDVSEAHFLVNWLLKTNDFLVGNFKRIYYKTRKTLLYYYVDRGSRIPVQLRKTYTFDKYNDMIRTYRTNEKYEGEILLFRASKNKSKDRYLGWDKIVGHVRLIYLEGDHGSLLKEEISMKLFKETFNDYVKEVQQKITKEESLQQ